MRAEPTYEFVQPARLTQGGTAAPFVRKALSQGGGLREPTSEERADVLQGPTQEGVTCPACFEDVDELCCECGCCDFCCECEFDEGDE